MLTLRPFLSNQEPIFGEAIQLEVVGEGYGILMGGPWLKVESRSLKIAAKKFSKAVVFRKLPVSLKYSDLPSLSRRPRLVKAKELVKIVLDKPVVKLTLISLPTFKKYVVDINPKGVVVNPNRLKIIKPTVRVHVSVEPNRELFVKENLLFPKRIDSKFKLDSKFDVRLKLNKVKVCPLPSFVELGKSINKTTS
jgi:hypothetical protein